ncbi:HAD-IA family hydrolase [Aliarcobacter vitoriensis]|uniref:HAD-IA family hydrolase n=1 Tax=Aliarcobacter vitoriensis TaxID=2011099 RepID=UPI003AACD458
MKSLLDKDFEKYLNDENIKYISFDIFDTLVFRKINQPVDIFEIMANYKYIKNIFGKNNNFKELRIIAEKVARDKSSEKEIALNDIYREFEYLSKKQQNRLIKLELKVEKENLFINYHIEKWIDLALQHGKKIIFISDMYLNKEQIKKVILNRLINFKKIEEIFVSSDIKRTKYDGDIYNYILSKCNINSSQILHIGDNLLSDISQANEIGISTIFYKPNYFYLEQLRHEKSYYLFSQKTVSYRNLASLNNPYKNEKYKFFYNFGATICGPIFWEFSHWLINICLENRLFNIGFILREGDVFKDYFQKILKYNGLEKNFILKNIHTSRKALLLSTLTEEDYNLDFKNLKFFRKITLKDFYKRFDLLIDNEELKKYDNEELNNLDHLKSCINQDIKGKIEKILENKEVEKKLFLEYWKTIDLNDESIIFDFGANSSMHKKLSSLLINPNFTNILFYRTKQGIENSINQKQYTFIPYTQQNEYKINLLRRSPDIFEILFNGLLGTTLGYERIEKKVVPIIDKNITIQDKNIIKAFIKGIDKYFKISIQYKQDYSKFTPNDILNLMTRVIEFPTIYETKYLGELLINTSDDASSLIPIISTKSIEKLKQNGIDETFYNFKNNLYKDWVDIPWIQGTITQVDPNYLKNRYLSDNTNQLYIYKLLEQIDKYSHIKEFCIYGAGEFFLQLLPELLLRGIKVNYLIETKPKQNKFFGYDVLSPNEIAKTEQKNFIIASGAFALAMKEKLEYEFKLLNKSINNLIYLS